MKPEFIEQSKIESFKKKHPELTIHDETDLAINELFDIHFPSKKDTKTPDEVSDFKDQLVRGTDEEWGSWVYYPWLNQLVHIPPKDELRALRTSRNRNLISIDEQKKLYNSTILIIGMSVGSNIVEAVVSHGIGKKLILVDMDIIEPSNLNRIRSPYHHVGLHKVDAISRKVWEIDPYIEIVQYNDGLTEDNLEEILENYKPDVVVDEMDDLRMKILVREQAKKRGLPVVMAADDGDNTLLDIERYDLDSNLELFSGLIPAHILDHIKHDKIERQELGLLIGKYFVGPENTPLRMFESLMEVGKTLPSWPQLGGAAALSGICVAYAIRRIILGEDLKAGRTLVAIDKELDREQYTQDHKTRLQKFYEQMKG